MTLDCGQNQKGQRKQPKQPIKPPLCVQTQVLACESQDREDSDTYLHMLTYTVKMFFTFWLSEFVVNTESSSIPQAGCCPALCCDVEPVDL